jgi:phytoene synthase
VGSGDLALVRLYWPVELRPAFDALMAIDSAFAAVVTSSSEPALGAIRLAWWREALERLDQHPAPLEPRLQAASIELLARRISGADLAEIEDGYATLLEEAPDADRVAQSGATLFRLAARLLGADDPLLANAGALHAYSRAVRSGRMAFPTDIKLLPLCGHRFPRALRPLTALARLASRDVRNGSAIEPEATPARAVALLSHRMFGTVA